MALALTKATNPVPQVRRRRSSHRPHQDGGADRPAWIPALHPVTREFGWEVAAVARFLVSDMRLARPNRPLDEQKLLRSLAKPRRTSGRRRAAG